MGILNDLDDLMDEQGGWVHMVYKHRKFITFAVKAIVSLVLVVVVAVTLGGLKAENNRLAEKNTELEQRIKELLDTPIVVEPIAPKIELQQLYSKLNEIAELATMEYLFTDAAKFTDSKQLINLTLHFTEKSFTLKWNGVIKAGIENLDDVKIDINEDEKKITISLPQVEILSYEVDTDSVQVLDEKNNLFNRITVDDKIRFDSETEDAMKERAIESGLLEKAQKNAENIIARLFLSDQELASYYTIEFVTIKK